MKEMTLGIVTLENKINHFYLVLNSDFINDQTKSAILFKIIDFDNQFNHKPKQIYYSVFVETLEFGKIQLHKNDNPNDYEYTLGEIIDIINN